MNKEVDICCMHASGGRSHVLRFTMIASVLGLQAFCVL